MCPFRHISGEKTVVCKHWLRGLCKKGDQCEFLHEYDMTKMPECYFYSKFGSLAQCFIKSLRWARWLYFPCDCCSAPSVFLPPGQLLSESSVVLVDVCFKCCVLTLAGECSNKECPFLHIDPESKIKDCPWYDRGFCKHGRSCSAVDINTPAVMILTPDKLTVYTHSLHCWFDFLHQQQNNLFTFCCGSSSIFLSQVLTADTDTQDEWSVWITLWASVQKGSPVNSCSMLPFLFDS